MFSRQGEENRNFSKGASFLFFSPRTSLPFRVSTGPNMRVNTRVSLLEDVNGLEGHSPKPVCGTAVASFPHTLGSSSRETAAK